MKKLLLLLSVCIAAQSYAQNVPAYVPTNGLVAWWPFTGNAIDSSGNGINGIVNGATLTTDRFGNANKAYSFNGSSNSITVNDANSLDLIDNFSSYFLYQLNGNRHCTHQIPLQTSRRVPHQALLHW
jgi:hypothetical protein